MSINKLQILKLYVFFWQNLTLWICWEFNKNAFTTVFCFFFFEKTCICWKIMLLMKILMIWNSDYSRNFISSVHQLSTGHFLTGCFEKKQIRHQSRSLYRRRYVQVVNFSHVLNVGWLAGSRAVTDGAADPGSSNESVAVVLWLWDFFRCSFFLFLQDASLFPSCSCSWDVFVCYGLLYEGTGHSLNLAFASAIATCAGLRVMFDSKSIIIITILWSL